jgi:WD40 repeat protein/tetratricopeptide (TPR) repeat protein
MIAASDVMVFVVTPASAASNVCDDEIAHARSLGKRIVAILRRDIDFNTAPERLRALNVELDFRDDSHFAVAYEALAAELTTDINWHRRGSRLMRQAQQWDADGRPQGQLLRAGAIDEADRWAASRPGYAPEPGQLVLEFLGASRKKEREDSDEHRRIIGRAFVKPARQMFEDRQIVAGMRITAAGLLLSDDIEMGLVPELDHRSGFRQAAFFNAARSTFHGPAAATFSPDGLRIVTVRDNSEPVVRVWERMSGKLIAPLRGHTGWVRMAAFAPDGRHIVTASADGTARVWDTECGTQISCLSGHGAHVYTGMFSSDGKRVVTASGDGTARIWDAFTGREIARLQGHLSEVTWAEFSLDNSRVVTTSMDFTARIWRVEGKPRLQSLIMHEGETIASLSDDGTRVVTASKGDVVDRTVRVWDVATGKKIGQFQTEIGNFTVVKFSPDRARILTATMESTASIWDATSFKRLFQLRGHTDSVIAAAFSPDSTKIATASADTTVLLWDAADGDVLNIFKGHYGEIITAAFCPDGKSLATGAHDQTVRLWDCSLDNFIALLQSDDSGNINNVAFSPDGTSILTVGNNAHIWNAETFKEIPCLSNHHNLASAVFSADGSRIIAVSTDQSVSVWESRFGREIMRVAGVIGARILGVTIGADSLSPDGAYLVAPLTHDNAVGVWNCATGTEIARLPGHADGVQYCLFHPDGTKIITVGDNTVRVWDIVAGKEATRLKESFQVTRAIFNSGADRMLVTGAGSFSLWDPLQWSRIAVFPNLSDDEVQAAFSPDGSQFVTACQGIGIVWDSRTGEPRARLQGKVLSGCISFSPNGDRVAICMPRGLAGIWDIQTGALIATLPRASDASCVALSPDGMRAVTGSNDSVARVWDVARSSALVGPLSVALAANLIAGHGQRSESEREDLLMQMAPDDLCSALLEKLSEAQRADAMHRSTILASGLHSFCYLPPSHRPQALRRNTITVQEWEKEQANLSSNPQLDELAASLAEGFKDGSFQRTARTGKHPGGPIKVISIRSDQLVEFDAERNLTATEPADEGSSPLGLPGEECLTVLATLLREAKNLSSRHEHEAARDLLIAVLDAATQSFGPDSPSLVPFLTRLAESHFALGALKEAQVLEERALTVAAGARDEEQLDVIRNNLAGTLYEQGEYERARVLLEENVAVLTRTLGPDSPRTLLARHHFGETLKSLGHLSEAQDLFESVLEARLRVLGEDHMETLRTMDALASVYAASGDHARAKILYQREIEIHAANNRPDDSSFLTTVNNYAVTLQACGDLDAAGLAFERVLEGKRRIHGEAHPDTQMAMNSLAGNRHAQGDFDGAQPLLERVLAIRQDTLGEDHPETLTALDLLARFLWNREDHHGAAQKFTSLAGALVRLRGEDDPEALDALLNLAATSFAADDPAGACAALWRVHAIRARTLGDDHPDTARCLQQIGQILFKQADYASVERCLVPALEARRKHLGPEHADTLESMYWLAAARTNAGAYQEARPLQEHLLDVDLRAQGPEHPDTLASMRNLARTLTAIGDHTAARDLWQRLSDADARLSPLSTAAFENRHMLAWTLVKCRDLDAALSLYESMYEEEARLHGPEHERTLTARGNVAYVKYVKGELEEAQRIQQELISVQSRVLGPDHPKTLTAINNLAETLFERGDVEEALRLHTHVLDSRRRVLGDDHDDVRASEAKLAKARTAYRAQQ